MSSDAGTSSKHPRSEVQLQFVSVTQENYEHGKLRQDPTVRRHVMRHLMLERTRRERLAATKEFQRKQGQCPKSTSSEKASSSASSAFLASENGPDQITIKEEESRKPVKLELIKQHPAAWMLDPFGSFAASLDRHTQDGLEYCKFLNCFLKFSAPQRHVGVMSTLHIQFQAQKAQKLSQDLERSSVLQKTEWMSLHKASCVFRSLVYIWIISYSSEDLWSIPQSQRVKNIGGSDML